VDIRAPARGARITERFLSNSTTEWCAFLPCSAGSRTTSCLARLSWGRCGCPSFGWPVMQLVRRYARGNLIDGLAREGDRS
jgi:hypothetical protein